MEKVAIVTAAANGIGHATAIRLARDASAVVVIDLDSGVERTADEIERMGKRALPLAFDVTNDDAVEINFRTVLEKFGRVDILANCVGGGARDQATEFYESRSDTWRLVIERSLVSAMLCARQVVPGMRERRYGKIVSVSSTQWLVPSPTMVDYGTAKSALLGFTRTLAIELAEFSVNVNLVSPGPILTPGFAKAIPKWQQELNASRVPMKRLGAPEEVANGIGFLASDEASYITGQHLLISGGKGLS